MKKKEIIILITISLLLFIFDCSYRLLQPTSLIKTSVKKSTVVHDLIINVSFSDVETVNDLSVYRISPLGYKTPVVLNINNGFYYGEIKNQYINGIKIYYKKDLNDIYKSLKIKIGGKKYSLSNENTLKIDDHTLEINKSQIISEKSIIPFFNKVINYKGDMKFILPGIFYVLIFIFLATIPFFINKYLKVEIKKIYLLFFLLFIFGLIIYNFCLTWKIYSYNFENTEYVMILYNVLLIVLLIVFAAKIKEGEYNKEIILNNVERKNLYIVLVILLAIFLRIINIGKLGLTTDEIYIGIAVKEILNKGLPIMPDGTFYSRGITHSYLGAFFSYIPGISLDSATRLPSIVGGLLIILFSFLIVKMYAGYFSGICIALFLSIFPWTIEFSRWGRMYSLTAFSIFAVTYYCLLFLRKKKYLYLFISILFTVFAVKTDVWGYFSILIIFLTIIICYIDKNKIHEVWSDIKIRKKSVLTGIFLVILFSVILNTEIKNWVFMILRYFKKINISFYFLQFILFYFGFLMVGIFIVGFDGFNKKIQEYKEYLLLFLVSLSSLLFVSLFHLHLVPRYIFFVVIIWIIVSFIGFFRILSCFGSINRNQKIIAAFVFLIHFISLVNPVYSFSIPFREHGDKYYNPYYAPTTVSDYIADRRNNALKASDIIKDGDIVFTTGFNFYYYYTGNEADYWLRPGNNKYFSNKDNTIRYMQHTKLISSKMQLLNELEKTNYSKRLIFIVNLKGGSINKEKIISSWINDEIAEYYYVDRFYTGKDKNSLIYIAKPKPNKKR